MITPKLMLCPSGKVLIRYTWLSNTLGASPILSHTPTHSARPEVNCDRFKF